MNYYLCRVQKDIGIFHCKKRYITSYYVCANSYSEAEAIIKDLMKFDKMLSLVALSEKPSGNKRVIKCGSHVYNVWSNTLKSLLCRRSDYS